MRSKSLPQAAYGAPEGCLGAELVYWSGVANRSCFMNPRLYPDASRRRKLYSVLPKLSGPSPTTTDGEASNPGLCAAAESQNRVVGPIGDALEVQPSGSSADAPPTEHTDTQRLVVKTIAKSEASGDFGKAAFLNNRWKVDDENRFTIPKQSMG